MARDQERETEGWIETRKKNRVIDRDQERETDRWLETRKERQRAG
jgi:hypothetical protein